MLISFIRTSIIYILVVAIYRLMGKRQIGELQPSELVLAIMVSDLATIPVGSVKTPMVSGIIPIVALVILEIFISYLSQKSEKIRVLVTGKPSMIIENGRININEMNKLRFNIDDLFEQLRSNGYMSVSEVEYAILETNGQLSILPNPDFKGVTLSDLKIKANSPILPRNIIKDGKVQYSNLTKINKNYEWLKKILDNNNLKEKEVFLLTSDGENNLYIQKKE